MKLKDYLDSNGLSGLDMSRLCKVTPQTIYRLINKKGKPSMKLAATIFKKTGGKVTVEELFR